ncbi:MAG: mechanosensitive ion channel protein MscS [Archangium gephyra]|uniref:Mechanosensitive ion channel protein MscS n=1 Tax=Archangium gephyra TaxID=48 RepID=A0A2W5SM82_9BACT|nr:MAG: mechanosensitive ion channel protein MscS [Archangium gephyra]
MSWPEFNSWLQEGARVIITIAQALAILLGAWLLLRVLRIIVRRICDSYHLPAQVAVSARRLLGVLVYMSAFMLALGRLGVSGSVLWTALTGFTAVAAVAFFAAWSVLSNIFCSVLILTTRPFRVHDHIEVLENGDKPGLRGRVIDINLLYTTLLEEDALRGDTVLQIPNSQFFQRTTRRWRSGSPPAASAPE